jgi:adenylyltransferase/sulfurtransferase
MSETLTPDEVSRYQRHLSLAGFGVAGQERLKSGSVLMIGAGGLGCPALLYLAAAGVGRIVIVDHDRVEISNLQRQVLYTEADAGELKAEAAARRLLALNPAIAVEAAPERFARGNALELVGACDVVVDGSDNFPTRYLVNDACVLSDKPFVYGAVQGFSGQVSVFNWRGGPTYRCLFAEPPEPGTVANCAEAGVLGVLPGLVGTAQACEAIKLLTGIGEPLSGRLLLWDALAMEVRQVALPADPRSREITALPPDGYGETCAVAVQPAEEVDVAELRAEMSGGRTPQLIDVREGWERAMGSIEPSRHLPLGELAGAATNAALEGLNRSAPTVVYCAVGVRSLYGAQILRERFGFRSAASLRGGYQKWIRTK